MKIALIGYGKMGKTIEEIALERGHEVVMRIDVSNTEELTAAQLHEKQVDVAIEFTHPGAAFSNLSLCIGAGIPVVSGTTGWLDRYEEILQLCRAQKGAFLYASNFSIGVNIFFAVNRKLAELMAGRPEYGIRIEEVHHTAKRDAPSGTAISLAEQVMEKISRKTGWVNHPSQNPEELVILSERTDPAPGTHRVRYTSDVDDIEIIHTAHNRKGFASGAVLAAEFLKGKTGVFSMREVLGL